MSKSWRLPRWFVYLLLAIPLLWAVFAWAAHLEKWGVLKAGALLAVYGLIPFFILWYVTRRLRQKVSRANQALAESEAKYRVLVENLNEGITLIANGRPVYANPAFLKLLGYTEEEYSNLDWTDIIADSALNAHLIDLHHQGTRSAHGPAHRLECELTTKGGSTVTVLVSAAMTVSGERRDLIAMISDVTKQKELEAELARAHKLEALGVLAGGIAHDFNNILATILGSVTLAKRAARRDPQGASRLKSLLESAQKATLRAKDLTGQLLTFSKGGDPVVKSTSLKEVLLEAAEFALIETTVEQSIEIADDLWPANVDTSQISQVFSNLIINANQAMPDGGTISIRAENLVDESGDRPLLQHTRYVHVAVSDTGIGIEEEVLPRIFDPYFTTKPDGNGLGLATSFSIVRRHGGQITVRSQQGYGTTFDVYLPAAGHDAAPTRATPWPVPQGGAGRILVMDDDAAVLQIATDMLEELGYEVTQTSTGEQAVTRYKERAGTDRPFDVVMMDLTVPGAMGGREAIEHLLAFDPTVTAIVLSGYNDDPVIADYQRFGFKGRMKKPFTLEEMDRVIRHTRAAARRAS